jgi:histidinol dehydrogenase
VAEILADVRCAATPQCWSTPRASTACRPPWRALEIGPAELRAALDAISPAQRRRWRPRRACAATTSASSRPAAAAGSYRDGDGTLLGQKVTPLDRVGIYVPGGKAAYPSSVLMNAMPAQVAGVGEIVMVVPTPHAGSAIRWCWLVRMRPVAGVSRVFTIGGAQAVARAGLRHRDRAAVDKITGPGNAYVASAKRRVFGQVGIDMIAGPSEILVLADGSTPADWVAMDLFSQAEHDELAQSILLCPTPPTSTRCARRSTACCRRCRAAT